MVFPTLENWSKRSICKMAGALCLCTHSGEEEEEEDMVGFVREGNSSSVAQQSMCGGKDRTDQQQLRSKYIYLIVGGCREVRCSLKIYLRTN